MGRGYSRSNMNMHYFVIIDNMVSDGGVDGFAREGGSKAKKIAGTHREHTPGWTKGRRREGS